MPRYLLSQIKDDPVVSFKCEGCGERFPAEKLYGVKRAELLEKGEYASGRYMISMICSHACFLSVQSRSVSSYERWFESQFAESVEVPVRRFEPLPQLFLTYRKTLQKGHHKTHCKYGHEYTVKNTALRKKQNGYVQRECRICHSKATSRSAQRRKKVA